MFNGPVFPKDVLGFLLPMIMACFPDLGPVWVRPGASTDAPGVGGLREGLVEVSEQETDGISSNELSDLILGTEGRPCRPCKLEKSL